MVSIANAKPLGNHALFCRLPSNTSISESCKGPARHLNSALFSIRRNISTRKVSCFPSTNTLRVSSTRLTSPCLRTLRAFSLSLLSLPYSGFHRGLLLKMFEWRSFFRRSMSSAPIYPCSAVKQNSTSNSSCIRSTKSAFLGRHYQT